MLRALQDALAAPPRSPAAIVLAAAPAPVVAVSGLLASAPTLLWEAPAAFPRAGAAWSFVGWGEAARLEGAGDGRLDEVRASARALFAGLDARRDPALEGAPPPRLFGGIAFRPRAVREAPWAAFGDASFTLPRWLYATDGERALLQLALGPGERALPGEMEAMEVRLRAALAPAPRVNGAAPACPVELERTGVADWTRRITDALARIRARELEKVVPATCCHVISPGELDVAAALGRMRAAYPECARFAFQRGDSTFVGASPERLVALRGLEVATDALAGSRARARDAEGDERAIRALLASDKDRREHHLVALAIERALRPLARSVRVPEAPSVRSLRNVHHLWTPIEATLSRPLHALDLVEALHPTPAVCGTPREAAFDWIAAHEPPRGWYAGAVGWFDGAGDGDFAVAIRSGVLARREAWLWAGAGIVEGSDPEAEYAETRVKQAPMLAALGLLP